MEFRAITYRTLNGPKEIIETLKNKHTEWVIYQDDKPTFYVDFYDLETESNGMMNSLIMVTEKTMDEVLSIVSERNNVNLSVPKASFFGFKLELKSEKRELDLQPFPKEWLSYSL